MKVNNKEEKKDHINKEKKKKIVQTKERQRL